MPLTDNCYRRRKTESLEIEMIFAIRKAFHKARLTGKQIQDKWMWRIVDGPFKDMVWCTSIERAWVIAYCAVADLNSSEVEDLIAKMRGRA